jgi:MFS family permease
VTITTARRLHGALTHTTGPRSPGLVEAGVAPDAAHDLTSPSAVKGVYLTTRVLASAPGAPTTASAISATSPARAMARTRRSIVGMRRLFMLVAAVVLVDTAFYAAIAPLLPHYESELGLSKTAAGILTASYAAGTVAGAIPAGWLAARAGVKPALLLGLGLMAGTSLVFGFANDIVALDVARFVQGVGGACSWAAGMAWLVAAAPSERRGELLGAALSAAIVGVMLGPVLGGAATVVGPEAVFSGVAALGLALAAWAAATPAVPCREELSLRSLVVALRKPPVAAGFWLFLLPALFAGVINVLVPLRLDELGASGVAVGAAFLVAALVEAVMSPLAGRLSDRRGRLAPIRVGLLGAVGMSILLPLPGAAILTAAALVAAVLALALFWAPAMAWISDASEQAGLAQGLAFALANLAWGGGIVAGSAAGGALAEATADAVPYAILAVSCGLTFVWVTRARPQAQVTLRPQAPQGFTPSRR